MPHTTLLDAIADFRVIITLFIFILLRLFSRAAADFSHIDAIIAPLYTLRRYA